jgi:16S rRNA U516 pseudouridylate synthase RsuA-like enzyme
MYPKLYELTTADPLDDKGTSGKLLHGVVLNDDPEPVKATACEQVGSHQLHLTLTEGKYHQVKRMLGAGGTQGGGFAPLPYRWSGVANRFSCGAVEMVGRT